MTAVAEQSEPEPDGDGGGEEPEASVESEREGGEGAGERDVAEGVAAEDLASEHDEVADESTRGSDAGAGEERVPDEGMREHVGEAGARGVGEDRHVVAGRRSCSASAEPSAGVREEVGAEREGGDVEADGLVVEVGEREAEPGHESAMVTLRRRLSNGRMVMACAAAAGTTSSAKTRSTPVIWPASATARPSTTRNRIDR